MFKRLIVAAFLFIALPTMASAQTSAGIPVDPGIAWDGALKGLVAGAAVGVALTRGHSTTTPIVTGLVGGGLGLVLDARRIFVGPSSAAAQEVPAPKVKPGQHVWLIMDGDRTVEGDIVRATPADLEINTTAGVRTYAVSSVRRIEKPDSVKNGALIGLAVGAAYDIAWMATPSERRRHGNDTALVAVGLTTAVGAAIDFFIPGRDVVWDQTSKTTISVLPAATLHSIGFNGQVRW